MISNDCKNAGLKQFHSGVVGLLMVLGLAGLPQSLLAACDAEMVIDAEVTVKDNSSGLVWARCLLGQSGSHCGGSPLAASWVDTLNKARGSELGGITNWRMPRIEEIEMLYAVGSSCLRESFPGLGAATVWSASANIDYATDAWAFDVDAGKRLVRARDSELQVWLVSGPIKAQVE